MLLLFCGKIFGMTKKINATLSKEKKNESTNCQLVESFYHFWPAFQRWSDSQTPGPWLTPQRARILAFLREHGQCTMVELKREIGVTATNITALVDALERDGLVTRKPHPEDRRATLLEITSTATSEMSKACVSFRPNVAQIFDILSLDEQDELLRMMTLLRENLTNSPIASGSTDKK